MTLPITGAISASAINTELTKTSTAQLSLNDTDARRLASKTTQGQQISYSDFWGKSYTGYLVGITASTSNPIYGIRTDLINNYSETTYTTGLSMSNWGMGNNSSVASNGNNEVLVILRQFVTTAGQILALYSKDRGATWQSKVIYTTPYFGQFVERLEYGNGIYVLVFGDQYNNNFYMVTSDLINYTTYSQPPFCVGFQCVPVAAWSPLLNAWCAISQSTSTTLSVRYGVSYDNLATWTQKGSGIKYPVDNGGLRNFIRFIACGKYSVLMVGQYVVNYYTYYIYAATTTDMINFNYYMVDSSGLYSQSYDYNVMASAVCVGQKNNKDVYMVGGPYGRLSSTDVNFRTYRSEDSGVTWTKVLDIRGVITSDQNGQVWVWPFSLQNTSQGVFLTTTPHAIYYSSDYGATFTIVTSNSTLYYAAYNNRG